MAKKMQEHEKDERRFRFAAQVLAPVAGIQTGEFCSHCHSRLATHKDAHGRPICIHCKTGGVRGNKPITNDQPRVGRNAPCPCGSGRKFKKCCLVKRQAMTRSGMLTASPGVDVRVGQAQAQP